MSIEGLKPSDGSAWLPETDAIEQQGDDPVARLPAEVVELIFAYLKASDWSSVESVSMKWRSESLKDLSSHMKALEKSAVFFANNLDPVKYSAQKEALFGISKMGIPDLNIMNGEGKLLNLNLLRTSFLQSLKNDILNILKQVEEADLDKLKKLSEGSDPEDIFNLVIIYKQIDSNKFSKKIAITLAEKGLFNKALEVANRLDPVLKDYTLHSISILLALSGLYEKAFEVAMAMSQVDNSGPLNFLYSLLVKRKLFDKATKVAISIPDIYNKLMVLKKLFQVIAETGDTDRALRIAILAIEATKILIFDKHTRSLELEKICQLMAETGIGNDEALKAANMIPDQEIKNRTIKKILNP